MKPSTIAYYLSWVAHRVLLCLTVGATIIHWMILISSASSLRFISELNNLELINAEQLNSELTQITNAQSLVVLRWVVITTTATILLLFIKRFRNYEKALVVDGLVIIAFCVLSVVLSQAIVRAYISGAFI